MKSVLLDEHKLLIACGHDKKLLERIRPFANLIREDSFGRPLVTLTDSIYVTTATTRRSTGTHYTPPSLTEPIVQHTLEPLVYEGPAEGLPREQWKLKSPKAILDLKVCDMAMGSGAFLVQACRYLAERLVEAWENLEKQHPGEVLITPEGGFSTGSPSERLVPADTQRTNRNRSPYRRRPLPLWRGHQPDGRGDGQALSLAHHLATRPALHFPRSRAQVRRFLAWRQFHQADRRTSASASANGRSHLPPPTCPATWRKPPRNAAPWKICPPTTTRRSKPRTACTPKPKPPPPRSRRWPTASLPLSCAVLTASLRRTTCRGRRPCRNGDAEISCRNFKPTPASNCSGRRLSIGRWSFLKCSLAAGLMRLLAIRLFFGGKSN